MVTNKKALIIDDSRTACLVLSRQLQKLGVMSDSVYSARAALDYLVDERPDVIFLDHSMPGMDGFEAIKVMKSDPATATIPVMMYTSNSGDLYLSQARALGALDVIQKNMEPGIIAKTLSKLGLIPKQAKAEESIEAEIAAIEKQPDSGIPLEAVQKNISDLEQSLQRKLSLVFNQQLSTLQKNLEDNIDYKSKKLINRSSKHVIEENKNLTEENAKSIQREIELAAESIQNQSHTQQNKIKWLGYITAFQLILVIVLISFQWSTTKHAASNSQAITNIQSNTNRQYSLLEQVIENQQNLNTHALGITDQLSGSMTKMAGPIDTKHLTSEDGRVIGKILSYSPENGGLNIINAYGYIFQLDAEHKIVSQTPKQFFRDQSCYGTAYVKSHKGLIFVDAEKNVWFTDVNAKPEVIIPASFLSDGECEEYYDEPIELIGLLPNQPAITGIESYDLSRG